MIINISKKTLEDIEAICDYLEESEKKHFQESKRPIDHIYRKVLRVNKFLKWLWL